MLIDRFPREVGLDDLGHFPVTPSAAHPKEMTLPEQVVHILGERRSAQLSGNPADFGPAHAAATVLHNQVRAEFGQPAETSAVAARTPSGGMIGTTSYTDGSSQAIEFNANGDIVNMRKP